MYNGVCNKETITARTSLELRPATLLSSSGWTSLSNLINRRYKTTLLPRINMLDINLAVVILCKLNSLVPAKRTINVLSQRTKESIDFRQRFSTVDYVVLLSLDQTRLQFTNPITKREENWLFVVGHGQSLNQVKALVDCANRYCPVVRRCA